MKISLRSGIAACLAAATAAGSLAWAAGERTAAAPVAVRGIEGIKGPKLVNLEKALQLQHMPPPPPTNANVAPLMKGPPGPPTNDPPLPTDERQLIEQIPPDLIGGS